MRSRVACGTDAAAWRSGVAAPGKPRTAAASRLLEGHARSRGRTDRGLGAGKRTTTRRESAPATATLRQEIRKALPQGSLQSPGGLRRQGCVRVARSPEKAAWPPTTRLQPFAGPGRSRRTARGRTPVSHLPQAFPGHDPHRRFRANRNRSEGPSPRDSPSALSQDLHLPGLPHDHGAGAGQS
jgi:hypothetical protein